MKPCNGANFTMYRPKNKHFEAADSMAAKLPYILTKEAKHKQQQDVLQALLAGLRGVK